MAPPVRTLSLTARGSLSRRDLPRLYNRARALLSQTHPDVVRCDVAHVAADAVAVDALARLQVAARRRGCHVELQNASAELLELVGFMGLDEALPAGSGRSRPDRAAGHARSWNDSSSAPSPNLRSGTWDQEVSDTRGV